jgi:geranylgeranyl diphosphate synthase, type III
VIVAHKLYGIPQTINTANYVYFLAFKELFPLCKDSGEDANVRLINSQELDHIVTGEPLRDVAKVVPTN